MRPRRHAIRLGCQVVRERDFRLVASQVVNLSEFGMLVEPFERVLTGENLIVSFMAPFSRTWVDAEATVVRVVHGRRQQDRGRRLGLHFEHIDAVSRALIRRHLDDVPPPLPTRVPPPPALAAPWIREQRDRSLS